MGHREGAAVDVRRGCSFANVQPVRRVPVDGNVACNRSDPVVDAVIAGALIGLDILIAITSPQSDGNFEAALLQMATIPPIAIHGASAIYGAKW